MHSHIHGLSIKELKSHGDERGFFREIIRASDPFWEIEAGSTNAAPFAQWSHSKMQKDVVKAWHFHHKQIDWWYIGAGTARAVMIDNREESPTYKRRAEFLLGDDAPLCVRIPTGVLHGLQVLTDYAHLFYVTSEIYDPQDEGRVPYNDPEINYRWCENPIVVENDKRLHIPPYTRTLVR